MPELLYPDAGDLCGGCALTYPRVFVVSVHSNCGCFDRCDCSDRIARKRAWWKTVVDGAAHVCVGCAVHIIARTPELSRALVASVRAGPPVSPRDPTRRVETVDSLVYWLLRRSVMCRLATDEFWGCLRAAAHALLRSTGRATPRETFDAPPDPDGSLAVCVLLGARGLTLPLYPDLRDSLRGVPPVAGVM
jgi:hypothetical protein